MYGSSRARGRPPPRSSRGVNVSWNTSAPVAAAIRAAARSPGSRVVGPPSSSAPRPDRNARAAASTASSGTAGRGGTGRAAAGTEALVPAGVGGQDQRRDAPRCAPPRPPAAASVAAERASGAVRTQCEAGRTIPSMSEASGAPSGLCATA